MYWDFFFLRSGSCAAILIDTGTLFLRLRHFADYFRTFIKTKTVVPYYQRGERLENIHFSVPVSWPSCCTWEGFIHEQWEKCTAVFDLEAAYACNFVEYVHRKNSMPFDIQAFTGLESLKAFAAKQKIEILLISDKAMCEEVKTLNIGQIVILSEGVHHPMLDCYPSVYKYQSSDAVIREVMNCYNAGEKLCFPMEEAGKRSGSASILRWGARLKLPLLLRWDRCWPGKKPVLYLNLEEYAGFEQLLGCSYERNIGDLIYYIRQEYNNLPLKISGMVQSVNNLDYCRRPCRRWIFRKPRWQSGCVFWMR